MIKISVVVKEIVLNDEQALESIYKGYLNISSYARTIRKEVESKLLKEVKLETIIVSLNRVIAQIPLINDSENLNLLNIHLTPGLFELTYEKTLVNNERLKKVNLNSKITQGEYLNITQANSEFTIIFDKYNRELILETFKHIKPVFQINNLCAVTVKFDKSYLFMPNVIFKLVRKVASHSVNIIEIVSTATELTFIIEKKDTELVISKLSSLIL